MKNVLIVILALTSLLTTSGCIVAAVGAIAFAGGSSYKYSKGDLTAREKETLNSSWSATQDAAEELKFHVLEVSKSETDAQLVVLSDDNERIIIDLKSESKSRTLFSIRVGSNGNEKKSKVIMDLIHKKS